MDKMKIVEALGKVLDPKSGQSIIMMNLVRDLKIEGKQVNFTIELPALDGQQKSSLNFACIEAVNKVYPDAQVNVHVLSKTPNPGKKDNQFPHIKNIIAVASGKGGVGKSTISTNLALALHEMGASVGLMDADLYGPSIPTMLGLQGKRPVVKEVYGQHKIQPLDAYGMPVMSIGFIIEPEQAVVLRGPRLAAIIKQFFNDCLWPSLDYLIVDLPPGTGDIQLTLVQTVPVTGVVLATTPQEVAVVDAVKAMNMFLLPSVNVPILGVVENMSWFTPKELPDNKYYLFGQGGGEKMAQLSKSALLGQVPLVQGVREGGDKGTPIIMDKTSPVATIFQDMAKKLVQQINLRNENSDPTQRVELKL